MKKVLIALAFLSVGGCDAVQVTEEPARRPAEGFLRDMRTLPLSHQIEAQEMLIEIMRSRSSWWQPRTEDIEEAEQHLADLRQQLSDLERAIASGEYDATIGIPDDSRAFRFNGQTFYLVPLSS